jgi:hypothetical protein
MGRGSSRWSSCRALLAPALLAALALATPVSAHAASDPREMLTYEPAGYTNSLRPAGEVDGFLADLDRQGIGQALLQLPALKKDGRLKLKRSQSAMVAEWAERAAAFELAHGARIEVTAVLNGHPVKRKLNLEDAAVRASVVSSAEALIGKGVDGIHLDFEPYPQSQGFVTLLEELQAAMARLHAAGRLSVVAPANLSRWPPAYVTQVSEHVSQLDPLFYDSEITTASAYESWVREGLAYYSAHSAGATRLVPVIPSYGPNPWHDPAVENISTATTALEGALSAGGRINGAGIWWWYGFFLEEEGAYDSSADQAAWGASTLALPFTP